MTKLKETLALTDCPNYCQDCWYSVYLSQQDFDVPLATNATGLGCDYFYYNSGRELADYSPFEISKKGPGWYYKDGYTAAVKQITLNHLAACKLSNWKSKMPPHNFWTK